MPIYDEPPAVSNQPRVSASAALELFWITVRCDSERPADRHPILDGSDQHRARLARRTREFWPSSEEEGFPEVIVIASRRGLLAGESLDEFLEEIPVSALRTNDLTLASETAAVRNMIVERLDQLAADRALRRRYLALLRDLWAAVRAEWESRGLPDVRRAAEVAERRLAAGEHPSDLAPRVSEPSLRLLRQRGTGSILVCPGYFAGRCVWELPGTLLLGFPASGGDPLDQVRARAESLSPRLKALADPTRLAILLRLGRAPASITDITVEFGISQPAVSTHFRVLRDAALVTGSRDGARTLYQVDKASAGAFIEQLSQSLA